jgi:hypothetical protein
MTDYNLLGVIVTYLLLASIVLSAFGLADQAILSDISIQYRNETSFTNVTDLDQINFESAYGKWNLSVDKGLHVIEMGKILQGFNMVSYSKCMFGEPIVFGYENDVIWNNFDIVGMNDLNVTDDYCEFYIGNTLINPIFFDTVGLSFSMGVNDNQIYLKRHNDVFMNDDYFYADYTIPDNTHNFTLGYNRTSGNENLIRIYFNGMTVLEFDEAGNRGNHATFKQTITTNSYNFGLISQVNRLYYQQNVTLDFVSIGSTFLTLFAWFIPNVPIWIQLIFIKVPEIVAIWMILRGGI